MKIFGSKIIMRHFKKLPELWGCFKRRSKENAVLKLKFIMSEYSCGSTRKINFLTFSDLLLACDNSSRPESKNDLGNKPTLVTSCTVRDTFKNDFVQQPNLGQMLNFTHIFYYLHPSFLSHQSFIMWNYGAATGKLVNDSAFKKGISIVNIDLAIKDLNSLESIISQHLNKFCSSFLEEDKTRNQFIKKVTKANKPVNSNTHPLRESKQTYYKKNNTLALKRLLAVLLELPEDEAFATIKKHPKRNCVPLEQLKRTHAFLIQRNYSLESIRDCSTILLYPKEKVEEILNFLHDAKVIENESEEKHALQLCVYYMEKPFHFSGQGVFPTEDVEKE